MPAPASAYPRSTPAGRCPMAAHRSTAARRTMAALPTRPETERDQRGGGATGSRSRAFPARPRASGTSKTPVMPTAPSIAGATRMLSSSTTPAAISEPFTLPPPSTRSRSIPGLLARRNSLRQAHGSGVSRGLNCNRCPHPRWDRSTRRDPCTTGSQGVPSANSCPCCRLPERGPGPGRSCSSLRCRLDFETTTASQMRLSASEKKAPIPGECPKGRLPRCSPA